MKDKKILQEDENSDIVEVEETPSKRRLLQALASGGAVIAGATLPSKWKKPMVDAALLPAHAVSTGCQDLCRFRAELSWDSTPAFGEVQDLDLLVRTPGGREVAPGVGGRCLTHEGDDRIEGITNTPDPATQNALEVVRNRTDSLLAPGEYGIFVRTVEITDDTRYRVRINVCSLTVTFQLGRTGADTPTISTTQDTRRIARIEVTSGGSANLV